MNRSETEERLHKPRFATGTEVNAPRSVVESGRLRLVSVEWGGANMFLRVEQYVYGAIDAAGPQTAPAFAVMESELLAWTNHQ